MLFELFPTFVALPTARRALRAMRGLVLLALACSTLMASALDRDAMLRAAQTHGPLAVSGARALQAVLTTLVGKDDATRLATINRFFNERIAFTSDMEVWGVEDYWASPLEMLGKGRGDCEDYVIGKYFSLIAAGMPPAHLRLVYVRATQTPVGRPVVVLAHMVLAYAQAPGDDPLILDNLIDEIRPASHRPDLTPVFSFNDVGLWKGVNGPSAGNPLSRLSLWRDVVAKVSTEGFQ